MYTKSHCLSRSKSCDFINSTQHLYIFENSRLDNISLPNLSVMHENTRVKSSRPFTYVLTLFLLDSTMNFIVDNLRCSLTIVPTVNVLISKDKRNCQDTKL